MTGTAAQGQAREGTVGAGRVTGEGRRPTVDVVIPCYNEVAALRGSVERTLELFGREGRYDWRLVIADNGSDDGTDALARSLEREHGPVRALTLTVKGRGFALREAWLGSDADVVAYMDVDLSTDLEQLPTLIGMVAEGGYDVVSGSRLARGAETTRSLKREFISRCYVAIIRAFFPRLRITDAQCGFKAVSRRAVEAVVPLIEDRAWFFDTELLVRAREGGLRVGELPVRWVEDRDTKVRIVSTAMEDLRGLLRLRFGLRL